MVALSAGASFVNKVVRPVKSNIRAAHFDCMFNFWICRFCQFFLFEILTFSQCVALHSTCHFSFPGSKGTNFGVSRAYGARAQDLLVSAIDHRVFLVLSFPKKHLSFDNMTSTSAQSHRGIVELAPAVAGALEGVLTNSDAIDTVQVDATESPMVPSANSEIGASFPQEILQ